MISTNDSLLEEYKLRITDLELQLNNVKQERDKYQRLYMESNELLLHKKNEGIQRKRSKAQHRISFSFGTNNKSNPLTSTFQIAEACKHELDLLQKRLENLNYTAKEYIITTKEHSEILSHLSTIRELTQKITPTHSIGKIREVLENVSYQQMNYFENALTKRLENWNVLNQRLTELEKKVAGHSKHGTFLQRDPKEEQAATIIQKAYRAYKRRKRLSMVLTSYLKTPQSQRMKQRNSLISEIVKTEEIYVTSLHVIKKLYIEQLRTNERGAEQRFNISVFDLQKIFNNIETITSMHNIFLMNLKNKLDQWPKVYIGDSFVNQSLFLLFYVEYVNGYNQAMNTLRYLRKENKDFGRFLNETKKLPESKNLSLESYLILPIQRLPRYELLLRELLKYTEKEHVDYPNLMTAFRRICAINRAINAKKREYETYSVIEKMVNDLKIFPNEIESHRVKHLLLYSEDEGKLGSGDSNLRAFFVREGRASLVTTDPKISNVQKSNKSSKVVCFLFDKCIVLSLVKEKKLGKDPIYKFIEILQLKDCEIISKEAAREYSLMLTFDPELEYLYILYEKFTLFAFSFDSESSVSNTHREWVMKIKGLINQEETNEDEVEMSAEEQVETQEIVKICDAMFNTGKFGSKDSFKNKNNNEENNTLKKISSFTFGISSKSEKGNKKNSKNSSLYLLGEDEEAEVKNFVGKVEVVDKFL
ncbi:hypothetical protein ABK040_009375 [Willaertia magna]